ncbi:MAG: metal-sulfur cluster assembly factor [Myxococcaceae bacterium]
MADEALRSRIDAALREVIDPELGLDVVSLGLVYGVDVTDGVVRVRLTMTTAACPLGESIMLDAEQRLRDVPGVKAATVELVWEPPWHPGLLSTEAREALGWAS